jgi:putative transposase
MNKLVEEILKNGDVKTVFDVESKLKQSFGKVIQSMLEEEMSEHLGHEKYEYSKENKNNYRNGTSRKKVKSNLGEIELNIPRDRKGGVEPIIVPKHSRDISNIEQQIINLYSMGTSTREIQNIKHV